jgi:hypothetical protein
VKNYNLACSFFVGVELGLSPLIEEHRLREFENRALRRIF